MMPCASAAFGKGNVIVGYNNTVDRDIAVFRILLQLLDAILGLFLRQRPLGHQVFAGIEA